MKKDGLLSTVKQLKSYSPNEFNRILSSFVGELDMEYGTSQKKSWDNSFHLEVQNY